MEGLGVEAESREWANSQSQGEAESWGRSWGASGWEGSQARGIEGWPVGALGALELRTPTPFPWVPGRAAVRSCWSLSSPGPAPPTAAR